MTQVVFVVVFPRRACLITPIPFFLNLSTPTGKHLFIRKRKRQYFSTCAFHCAFLIIRFWIIVYKLCTFLFLFCLVTRLILIDKLIMLCTTPLNMLTLLTVLFLVFVLVLASVLSFFHYFYFCLHSLLLPKLTNPHAVFLSVLKFTQFSYLVPYISLFISLCVSIYFLSMRNCFFLSFLSISTFLLSPIIFLFLSFTILSALLFFHSF